MDWTQFGQEIGRETSSMSYTGTLTASFCRSDALFKKKEISGCTFKQTSCGNTLKNYQFLFVDTKIPIIRYLSW